MNATLRMTLSAASLLFTLTQLCPAQLGATKEELVKRYGACSPNPGGKPRGPNVYDSVIDVGSQCYFYDGRIRGMALFKSDRVVGFHFDKSPTFWESFFHPFAYSYLPLSDAEISSLLHTTVPGTEWLPIASDAVVRRWRTSDSSAAAYYFAGGHSDLHTLVVQTTAVDEVYRKIEKY
jgi:hypothetical protein